MDRNTVRVAVLAALGIAMPAGAGIPAGTIPELENANLPKRRTDDALVRARWTHLLDRPYVAEHPGVTWAAQRLDEVRSLIGPAIAATQRLGVGAPLDLATTEGRIDSVLTCLIGTRDVKTCDLNTLLDADTAVARAKGVRGGASPWLDTRFRWNDLIVSCAAPQYEGGCTGRISVDARTGTCYQSHRCRRGRPYGEGRLAMVDGRVHTEAGRAWAEVALEEHASVAAFARHVLELMAVGAPLQLVCAATTAQLDEVRHTRLALGLARRLGADVCIGALPTELPPRTDLLEILLAVAQDGCIGETLSAIECAIALEQTDDPEIHRVLTEIVADEAQHAALAWRTLTWGLPRLDEGSRAQVLAIFESSNAAEAPECPAGIGLLGGAAAKHARRWGLQHVVGPATTALASSIALQ